MVDGELFLRIEDVMLIASYPAILDESTYLQNCIELEKNDAQMLPLFRNWNDFDYHIDLSTCTNIPNGLQNATLTIRDPKSQKIRMDAIHIISLTGKGATP